MSRNTIRLQPEILEARDLPSCWAMRVVCEPPPVVTRPPVIVAEHGHEDCVGYEGYDRYDEILRRGVPFTVEGPGQESDSVQMAPRIHADRTGLQAYPTAVNQAGLQAYPTAVNQAYPTVAHAVYVAHDQVMADYGHCGHFDDPRPIAQSC